MKNLNTIINAVLGIAVITLFVLYFNLKNNQNSTSVSEGIVSDSLLTEEKDEEVDSILNSKILDFPIAFVNIDTIAEKFDYYVKKEKEFAKAMENKSRSLTDRESKLNSEYQKFAQSIQDGTTTLVTREEVEKTEMGFQKRMQDLYAEKQRFDDQMLSEQSKFNEEIQTSLDNFLQKYKDEFNYSYVLQKGGGISPILYANDKLDITAEVVKALNKEYSNKLKTK